MGMLLAMMAIGAALVLASRSGHKVALITFATDPYLPHAWKLCDTAIECGFESARIFRPGDIDPAFQEEHEHVLRKPRGAGYWLWKPYIIHKTLMAMGDGEHVCYCDAMYEFSQRPYFDRTTLFNNKPGQGHKRFLVKQYTKMDVMRRFDAPPQLADSVQVWAGYLYLVKNAQTMEFVEAWLRECTDPHLLTDSPSVQPNDPAFLEHRHDQSLLHMCATSFGIRMIGAPGFIRHSRRPRPKPAASNRPEKKRP